LSDTGALLTSGLLLASLCFGGAVIVLAVARANERQPLNTSLAVLAIQLAATLLTWLLLARTPFIVIPAMAAALFSMVAAARAKSFAPEGRLLLLSYAQLTLWGTAWGIWFIAGLPVSETTRMLMFAAYPLIVLTLPIGLVSTFEAWEVLCRHRWSRPRAALRPSHRSHYPKVSIHVPACSEPPQLVISTLERLARLDYANFEVLVIDNNTDDEALWRPVEAHCRQLGERFRFFHLERCAGAKAGALNFALSKTSVDAELIAVVDADYHAEPNFLASLAGYFDDPKMGFVQTPHDYRGWEDSAYLKWCRWEYKYFFHTTMVSLNERDAAIIVGTMCLIRKRALQDAGGWSQWCLTEDSELAIRIHAAGYSSVYLDQTFGRGLIPESFGEYKRQRFRWTYGPIQELKAHIRLFLPGPWHRRSALTTAHKVHHLNHGLDRVNVGLGMLLMPLGVSIVASMLAHHEVVGVPGVLWITATVVLVGDFALKFVTYRLIGCSLRDAAGAMVASRALNHTIMMASLAAIFARQARWRRTNKFRLLPSTVAALSAVRAELAIGIGAIGFAAVVFAELPRSGLLTMLLIGVLYQALNYLAAPVMALRAEHDLRRRPQELHAMSTPISVRRAIEGEVP
jgi:cellulose synthase/poly-beta-1,6-N-acetylglucosamine synthase-like glycosyltransferase